MPDNTATFLWAPHLSPLHKAYFKSANTDSCLMVANAELSKVTLGILASPPLLVNFAWVSLKATLCQFFSISIGSGLIEYTEGSPPYFPIKEHINQELHEMKYAEQNLHRWNFTLYNYLNYIVLSISLLVIYCFWRSKLLPDNWRTFVHLSFLLMLANAFVTGSLANVLDRLQARTTWPFVLSAIIAVAIFFKNYLHNKYQEKPQ